MLSSPSHLLSRYREYHFDRGIERIDLVSPNTALWMFGLERCSRHRSKALAPLAKVDLL